MENETKHDLTLAIEMLRSKGYRINEFLRTIYMTANDELAADPCKDPSFKCLIGYGYNRCTVPTNWDVPRQSKVYISGPIAHYDLDERKLSFKAMEDTLRADDLFPVNPFNNGLPQPGDWHDHMRVDISLLLSCDYIIFLPNWYQSKGCRLELDIAASTGIKVLDF